jgi:acetyl esterase/lipase
MLTTFTRMGFVGASIEYRFTQEAPFPAQLEDCKCAIRFLRSNAAKYSIDSERIGAWGISAGGHLATMLAVTGGLKQFEGTGGSPDASSRVQAACNWCGPNDLPTWFADGIAPYAKQAVTGLIGGAYEKQKERAAQASPVTHATADDAPMLIMHGDKDDLVPLTQAQYLARALERVGVKHKLTVVKGGGHVFISPANNAEVLEFFTRELKATP